MNAKDRKRIGTHPYSYKDNNPSHKGAMGSGSESSMGSKGTVGTGGKGGDMCKGAQGTTGGKKGY